MKFQRRNQPPRGSVPAEETATETMKIQQASWKDDAKGDRSPMCLLPLRLGIPGKRRKEHLITNSTSRPPTIPQGGREMPKTARQSSASSSNSSAAPPTSAIAHLQALRDELAQNDMGDDTHWDWQALAEELNRRDTTTSSTRDREAEPRCDVDNVNEEDGNVNHFNDDEEDDILVRRTNELKEALRPPPASLDAENASIDAVIRKVAMLRAPLRYDEPETEPETEPEPEPESEWEPELTPIEVQQRWLSVAIGAIEFERRRQTGQHQQPSHNRARGIAGDAPRDPNPGEDRNPKVATTRGLDSIYVDRRDDEETSMGRSMRQRQDPSPVRESREPIRDHDSLSKMVGDAAHPSSERRRAAAPIDEEVIDNEDASVAPDVSKDDDERDGLDEVESSRHEEPKQSDYVYLQIEKRNTSGDDDNSVSSMEYLFNWLTCVNVEEELKHKKRLADPSKKRKGKKDGSVPPADTAEPGTNKKRKDKQVKAPPTSSPAPHQRSASSSPRKVRQPHVGNSDAVGSRRHVSPTRRPRLVDPQQQQPPQLHGLNYRPSLQRGNRSSGTVTTLSTTERITNIIDRTDAWLKIGSLDVTHESRVDDDYEEDLDEEGMGEEVQLSPKRKPTLQVPRDETVRYHPTLSGREPSTVGKPQRTKGKRVSMRSRKEKSGTFH